MSSGVALRILWKEYRILRSFWVVLAVAAVAPQLIAVFFMGERRDTASEEFLILAGAVSALYALVCGATLFAAEHESGTYEFLRIVPCSLRHLLAGKLVFCVVSTLALLVALSSAAVFLSGGELSGANLLNLLAGYWAAFALHGLAWGGLFSLLTVRPILAVFLGSVTTVVFAGVTVDPATRWSSFAFGAAVLLGDVLLAKLWFQRDLAPEPRTRWSLLGLVYELRSRPFRMRLPASPAWRLLWQEARRSGWMLFAFVLFAVVVILLSAASGGQSFAFAILLLSSLLGSCVFLSDQSNQRFRFFAEQGVRPREIWRSRLVFWGVGLVLLVGVSVEIWLRRGSFASASVWLHAGGVPWHRVALCVSSLLIAFTSGQLCSMFFSSGLLAAFFGSFLAVVLCGWALLLEELAVSWVATVLPIPFVLLFATWLRAPGWILERNDWRAWLAPAGVLGGTAVILTTVMIVARVTEIPSVELGFSPDAEVVLPDPEATKTAELYLEAYRQLVSQDRFDLEEGHGAPFGANLTEQGAAWLDANTTSLELAVEASLRPSLGVWASGERGARPFPMDLIPLLAAGGQRAESAGRLDEAFDLYRSALSVSRHLRQTEPDTRHSDLMESRIYEELVEWGGRSDQTRERVMGAIAELESYARSLPDPREKVKWAHDYAFHELAHAGPAWLVRRPHWVDYWRHWMPWERARTARFVAQSTFVSLLHLAEVEAALAHGTRPPRAKVEEIEKWRETTDRALKTVLPISPSMAGNALLVIETQRRAVRLVLALQVWRLEHGELPDSLERLVGGVLDGLPLDPFSGKPFDYRPRGVPFAESWTMRTEFLELRGSLSPGEPFLRSRVRDWFFPIP